MSNREKDKSKDRKLTLSVQIAGRGDGTVTSTVKGIDCDHDCDESFSAGTVLELKATPDDGSIFTGWTGACTGAVTCSVTLDADKSVTATFTRIPRFDLTVTLAGNGNGMVTSSPRGISCGGTAKHGDDDDHGNNWKDDGHGGNCHESFLKDTRVTLTAAGTGGSAFLGWGGACSASGTNPTCTVTLTADATVTATFGKSVLLTVSTTVTGNGTGTGSVTGGGIACPGTCSASIASGTPVTLTATPGVGASFVSWGGGSCSGAITTCVLTMNAAKTVTATFQSNTVTVTNSFETGSSGSVSSNPAGINTCTTGPCVASFGSSVKLTANPGAGSLFSWTGACLASGTSSTCTLSVDAAKTVGVNFILASVTSFKLTIKTIGAGDVIRPDGNECYNADPLTTLQCDVINLSGDITLTATTPDGSTFVSWGGDAASCTNNPTCTVTMNADLIVTATFTGGGTMTSLAHTDSGPSPLRGTNSASVTSGLPATRSAFIEQQR